MHAFFTGVLDLHFTRSCLQIPLSSTDLRIFVPKIYPVSEFSLIFSALRVLPDVQKTYPSGYFKELEVRAF